MGKRFDSVTAAWIFFVVAVNFQIHADGWSVTDVNLQKCLSQLAQEQGWKTPQDFTQISCHNQNIAKLDGLMAFSNITKLSLYNNAIEQVAIDNLPMLRQLNVAKNKIQFMSLGTLPKLEELVFFDNRLKHVSLSQLPNLQSIKGNANKMKIFTYDGLPKLEKIYLFNNELETIDIHHVPALKYMDVRQNPMPDKLYEEMNAMKGISILHDGNADDW